TAKFPTANFRLLNCRLQDAAEFLPMLTRRARGEYSVMGHFEKLTSGAEAAPSGMASLWRG
ncbi:MAG TPA: hypothetical protein VN678_00355, partial [Acidobacteriaceae bacterium]|nr:hypothetical protein [Acidobacteriaceae bacterium]